MTDFERGWAAGYDQGRTEVRAALLKAIDEATEQQLSACVTPREFVGNFFHAILRHSESPLPRPSPLPPPEPPAEEDR